MFLLIRPNSVRRKKLQGEPANDHQTWRSLLRRSQPRCGKRTGRNTPRCGVAKQRGEQVQSDGDCRRHHFQTYKSQITDAHSSGEGTFAVAKGFRCAVGANTNNRQKQNKGKNRRIASGSYATNKRRFAFEPWILKIRGFFAPALFSDLNNQITL